MEHFSELDMYYLGQGTHYDVYKKLGAHPEKRRGKEGVYFAVWAPNAEKVSVIGTFNDWQEEANEMKRLEPMGVYELFVPGAAEGDMYKFYIETPDGRKLYKADPYANYAELRSAVHVKMCILSLWRFMRFIRVPGCVIQGGTMKGSILTVSWQKSWRPM